MFLARDAIVICRDNHFLHTTKVHPVSEPDWNTLVRTHSAVVTTAALRVLGCLADAEDIAQEVFLEAFRKWSPDEKQAWPGLLRRMAICRALDLLRSRQRSEPLEFTPSEALLKQEQHSQLRVGVARLPPRESEVFCLACFEQLSHEEIASVLHISRGSVAVALSKAKSRLTEMFQPTSGDAK
jgi:RNA polymerase sigma-70 factor, ECF subfamily